MIIIANDNEKKGESCEWLGNYVHYDFLFSPFISLVQDIITAHNRITELLSIIREEVSELNHYPLAKHKLHDIKKLLELLCYSYITCFQLDGIAFTTY